MLNTVIKTMKLFGFDWKTVTKPKNVIIFILLPNAEKTCQMILKLPKLTQNYQYLPLFAIICHYLALFDII